MASILAKPDFPGISASIQNVMALSDVQDRPMSALTNVVLKDPGLTMKLLRTANSISYNRSGRQVFGITHAISLMGIDRVSMIAGSLVYFNQFRKKTPSVKELVLLSMLSASYAKEVATTLEFPEGEAAYVCGMFCNLGELLVSNYFPTQYAEILRLMRDEELTPVAAAVRVLRYRFDDLGTEMARYWHLPDPVFKCMATEPPEGRILKDEAVLPAIVGLSHSLTTVVHRHGSENAPALMRKILEQYRVALRLTKEKLDGVTVRALKEMHTTCDSMNIPLADLRLTRQTEKTLETVTVTPAEPAPHAPAAETAAPSLANLLVEFTQEVKAMLERPDCELNNVLLMVLEGIQRGVPCDRVIFALADPDGNFVQGRLGLGTGAEELAEKFNFRLSRKGGPVGLALWRGQDLVIDENSQRLPDQNSEVAEHFGVPCLGLLPVKVDRVLVGCLYFERAEPLAIGARQRTLLGGLRDHVVTAIRRKRQN